MHATWALAHLAIWLLPTISKWEIMGAQERDLQGGVIPMTQALSFGLAQATILSSSADLIRNVHQHAHL